jgi:hypothetical protein
MSGTAAAARVPLAIDPAFDARLRALLERAVPRVLEQAAPLRPRLLVLMGSAASGEAAGVAARDGLLPLSDLDLGLFVAARVAPAERARQRADLRAALAPTVRELGLTHDPIDLGCYEQDAFTRLPLTLELATLVTRPCVLWGDASCLAARRHEAVPLFEPLRLVLNRVTETLLPAGNPVDPGWLEAGGPRWAAEPVEADWRAAHRRAKLVLDLEQAHLAAHGLRVPSIRRRRELLASPAGERWTPWRLRPAWPPPDAATHETTCLARETLEVIARRAGLAAFDPGDRRHWGRLLALETGTARERGRRWARLVRARPSLAGVALASRWAASAWPASLAALAVTLAWIDAQGAGPGDGARLRGRLVREAPSCQDLPVARWDAAWARALGAWVEWVRAAGG